ncbi:hypothetical protein [Mycobacterium sp.]|uniref:hypothetical protein n=1 Tax=Mycobacterium sp. TaxID=1785 RepID=UPI003C730623
MRAQVSPAQGKPSPKQKPWSCFAADHSHIFGFDVQQVARTAMGPLAHLVADHGLGVVVPDRAADVAARIVALNSR